MLCLMLPVTKYSTVYVRCTVHCCVAEPADFCAAFYYDLFPHIFGDKFKFSTVLNYYSIPYLITGGFKLEMFIVKTFYIFILHTKTRNQCCGSESEKIISDPQHWSEPQQKLRSDSRKMWLHPLRLRNNGTVHCTIINTYRTLPVLSYRYIL
jgi:hypothetical protein